MKYQTLLALDDSAQHSSQKYGNILYGTYMAFKIITLLEKKIEKT